LIYWFIEFNLLGVRQRKEIVPSWLGPSFISGTAAQGTRAPEDRGLNGRRGNVRTDGIRIEVGGGVVGSV
jgi:hypothetical protein